jgi:hypothetical protein
MVQRCERADHLQSTMPSYSHAVSSSLNKRAAWSSDASDMASRSPSSRCARAESTACFRFTSSNHKGGCEIHARTIAGVFAWASSTFTAGGIKTLRYKFGRTPAAWISKLVPTSQPKLPVEGFYLVSVRGQRTKHDSSSSWMNRLMIGRAVRKRFWISSVEQLAARSQMNLGGWPWRMHRS